jgi:hypothetical protein
MEHVARKPRTVLIAEAGPPGYVGRHGEPLGPAEGLREVHRQALGPTAAQSTGGPGPVVGASRPAGGGGLGGRCALAYTLPGSR